MGKHLYGEIEDLCRRLLGAPPDRIETPGGEARKTVVAVIDDRRFVISKRASPARARLEAEALRHLEATGAVPKLIGVEGCWVLQEHVSGIRLTEALQQSDAIQAADLLDQAVVSLVALKEEAARSGLDRIVPRIGVRPGWTSDLVDMPSRLANQLGLPAPQLDRDAFLAALDVPRPCFVKWDARPGNFLVRTDGSLCAFDWEHCGLRSALDDSVWLICDEWSPDIPACERRMLRTVAKREGRDLNRLARDFAVRAVLHTCVRLSLVFDRKKTGPWWNPAACLEYDRVGVTPTHVQRLCQRGARQASQIEDSGDLSAFLNEIATRVGVG